MAPGVELILKRMESKPEEFEDGGRWDWVLRLVEKQNCLRLKERAHNINLGTEFDEEEFEALNKKIKELRRVQFHHRIMKELLA